MKSRGKHSRHKDSVRKSFEAGERLGGAMGRSGPRFLRIFPASFGALTPLGQQPRRGWS